MPKLVKPLSFPLRLPGELDRLFDEIIHRPWGIPGQMLEWKPPIDLYETPDAFVLEMDIPGTKRDDIRVEVEGPYLVIEGQRDFKRTHNRVRFHYQERCCGEFIRQVALPQSVDKDRIEAELKDGVLRVTLPKGNHRGKK
jgi:HSP20 family protein